MNVSKSDFSDDFDEEPKKIPAVKILKVPSKLKPAINEKPKVQKIVPELNEIVYTTELDELKMKVRKEIATETIVDVQSEFDRNTEMIMMNAPKPFDQVVNRVFYKFFKGVCSDFFSTNCMTPNCPRKHCLPEVDAVRRELEKVSIRDTDEAYGVCLKFPKLFDVFFSLFAEIFIKKVPNFETRLSQMVMECEKNPRTHQKYFQVVEALVQFNNMQRYKAIKWLISHHTNSPHAQEIILTMITDAGPDLIRLMDYVNEISKKRTMPIKTIEKIALNVTTYQDPNVPYFVLNNLFQKPPDQLRQFDHEVLTNFLKFQTSQAALSSLGEDKLIELAKNLSRLR